MRRTFGAFGAGVFQRIRRKNCGSTLWLLLALMRLHQDREADLGPHLRPPHENARCAVIKLSPGRDVSDLYLRNTKWAMAIALHDTLGAAYLGACMCTHVIQICWSFSWRHQRLRQHLRGLVRLQKPMTALKSSDLGEASMA